MMEPGLKSGNIAVQTPRWVVHAHGGKLELYNSDETWLDSELTNIELHFPNLSWQDSFASASQLTLAALQAGLLCRCGCGQPCGLVTM